MVKRKTKQMPAKKEKRWFAAASGWGLSLSLGSGSTGHGNLKKREINYNRQDVKNTYVAGLVSAANFTHNTIYTAAPLQIGQGVTNGSRVGNSIHIRHMWCKLQLDTAQSDRPSVPTTVRLMLVACKVQSTPATPFTAGVGSTDIFFSYAGGGIIATPDPRKAKVLCDELLEMQAIGSSMLAELECTVNIQQQFDYLSDSSNYGTVSNLYWIAIPYICAGVSGTTLCGNLNYDFGTTYEDTDS